MKHLFTNKRKIKRRFRKIRNVFPLSLGILETDHTACNPHCIKVFSVSLFVSHPLSHPLATKTIKYECPCSIGRLASKPCCRLLLYPQNLPVYCRNLWTVHRSTGPTRPIYPIALSSYPMCLCIIHLALIVLISHGILLVRYCLNTPAPTTQKEKHTHYCVLVEKFDFEKFLIGG